MPIISHHLFFRKLDVIKRDECCEHEGLLLAKEFEQTELVLINVALVATDQQALR